MEPRKLIAFLDTVTPKQYAISPKDTLLAMLMQLQLHICIGGPTLGLTRGPPCYILMRQGNGISGWPKDMPP